MRKALNALYDGAAAVAGLFLFGLLVMVLLSVFGRQFHFYVPGTDAYAGYLMAASAIRVLRKSETFTCVISHIRSISVWRCGVR